MEYNYSREFKQPNKIYSFPNGTPIPFVTNGLRLEHIVVFGVFVVLVGVIGIFSLVTDINFIQSMFKNGWMLIIAAIGVAVWTLFSLKWDNKSFINYVLDRGKYYQSKNKRYEHELYVPLYQEKVTYAKKNSFWFKS